MKAWLSNCPMIPISSVYRFSGTNTSFMIGVGVPSVKCQMSISASIGQYYYHDPYIDMPRLSLVDKARAIGQIQAGFTKKWMVEFGSGVGQEKFCLDSYA